MWTCGTASTRVHTSEATGLPLSAAQVGAPTNSSAAAVGTTVTSWPDSVNRRSSSHDLYAAMPPLTPSTTRRPTGAAVAPIRLSLGSLGLGGDAGVGQVWEYHPQPDGPGQLRLVFESPSLEALAQLLQQKFSDPRLQQQLVQLAQQWERFFDLAQYGFRGTDPLSIEEGLRMADRFDLIDQLEQSLRRLPREDRLAEIDRRLAAWPGLFLAGNAYRGPSINACIADAERVADAAAAYLHSVERTALTEVAT